MMISRSLGANNLSGISIEPFRGDYEELQKMALLSWRDEYGMDSFPNFYRPAFLRFLFERKPDKPLLLAAYRGREIISFLANLPQSFNFRGKMCRAVYSCLMVTRKEWLRRGLGMAIIREALKNNRKHNFDFALLTLEPGHRSTHMINKLKESGSPVEFVNKNHVIARILDYNRVIHSENLKTWEKAALKLIGAHRKPKPNPAISLREYQAEDLDACLGLLNGYQDRISLALVWEREELALELDHPDVSQTLVFERDGVVKGLINFIYHEHLGHTRERWAWVNHVAFPDLTRRERKGFVLAFLKYVRAAGCIGAVEWMRNYYAQAPFFRARFFPYFRSVNLVSWTLNPDISLSNIPDVYEIQI